MRHHPLIQGRRRGLWCQLYPYLRHSTTSTAPSLKRPGPVASRFLVSLFSSLASLFPSSRPAVVSSRSRLTCLVSRSFPLSPFRSGYPSSTSSMRQTLATLFKRTGNTRLLFYSG